MFLYIIYKILTYNITIYRCVEALTRGASSKFPCPICLVPADQLLNLFQDYAIRTALSAEALVKHARTLSKDAGEELLKLYGLRNIEVSIINLDI